MVHNIVIKENIDLNENPKDGDDKMKNSNQIHTLEEAVAETQMGKCQVILIFLTGMSILGSSIENTSISYILPYAKCDLELTTREQGLLSAISYFGIVFTSHFWGFLADTWGRQKVMRVAAIGAFVFSFSSAFAMNTISMILLRFLAGAFVAGSSAGGFSYISEFHTAATATRATAFMSIALNIVWLLMSPLALWVIPMEWSFNIYMLEYKPWRFFLTCTSLVNLWNAVAFSFLPESPKFLVAMNRKDEALNILSRIYAINTGKSKKTYPIKNIESVKLGNSLSNVKGVCGFLSLVVKQTKPIFQAPLLTHTWKICYIIFVMFAIGHGAFMWFPDFLVQLQSYDGIPNTLCKIVQPTSMGNSTEQMCNIDNKNLLPFQILLVVGTVYVTIAALSSFYLKKIDPKKLVCGWLFTAVAAAILINVFTEFYSILISFVIFLSINVNSNIIMAITVNIYPTNYRSTATAFFLMCGRIGGVGGSSLVGLLLNNHCTLIFYLYGAIIASCAFVFMIAKTKPQ